MVFLNDHGVIASQFDSNLWLPQNRMTLYWEPSTHASLMFLPPVTKTLLEPTDQVTQKKIKYDFQTQKDRNKQPTTKEKVSLICESGLMETLGSLLHVCGESIYGNFIPLTT